MNSAAAATEPARPRTGRGLTLAPILRASSTQIRELGARRGTSLAHIKDVVESDPAVALNLFAQVNADLKRAGHAPVGDIPRAILFMGMAELPGRLTRASILEDVVDPGLGMELTRMLCRAHHASRQARAIGALTGGLNGDELLAASLTREGLPYLERLAAEPGNEMNLAAFNNFPPAPPDSHDAGETTTRCLDLAARFADATERIWDELALDELYAEIGNFTGRDTGDVARSLRRATVEAARAGPNYPSYTPALRLMSPGESARGAKVTDTTPAPAARVAAKPASPAAKRPATAVPQTANIRAAAPAAPHKAQPAVQNCVDRIARSAAAGDPPAVLLPLALQAICEGTGMGLALLLMRDKTSTDLRLRVHHGLELPAQLKQHAIAVDGNPLLKKLMAKPAAFQWLPEKHARALAGLPLKLVGDKPAFLYSLHVDEKPLGILIGCRPRAAADTLDDGFVAFKRIAVATRDGLQNSRSPAPGATQTP